MTASLCLALVVVAVALYVTIVYPNDGRIQGPYEVARRPAGKAATRVVSVLRDRLPHVLNVDDATFSRRRSQARALLSPNASMESRRFTSAYQVYVPVGVYPARLDARDALLVPAGSSLVIEPGLSGPSQIRLGLLGLGSPATLSVSVLRRDESLLRLTYVPAPESRLPLSLARYVSPDIAARAERWSDGSVALTLEKTTQIALTCETEGPACVVSDPRFDEPTEPRQSYVVIVVDTLRGDALDGGRAPRLSGLAQRSTVFAKALAPGNMTSPSTNALLACERPTRLGSIAFAYGVDRERREGFYGSGRLSFPARFARAGYETAMIGNVSVLSEIYGVGVHHGFSRQISLETEGYDTPQIAREAVRWLEENGDRPFLLYLHFNGPHAPYRAPFRDLFAGLNGFSSLSSYPDALYALYQGEIAYTDRYVGKILDALEALDLDRHVTVVVTADHGDQHEIRPFVRNTVAPDFEGAYFDHGATLLNDEIRVPLMIRRPDGIGRVVKERFVSTLDVGATLLDLAGLKQSAEGPCDGVTLAPLLSGLDDGSAPVIGSEGFAGRAIVFGNRYKYIKTYSPTDKRVYDRMTWSGPRRLYLAPEQLYDLASDPGERQDLSRSEPELLERARQTYRTYYGVTEATELVIENPEGKAVEAWFSAGSGVTAETFAVVEGEGALAPSPDGGAVLRGSTSARLLLRTSQVRVGVPRVRVGGVAVPVTFSSLHLPLSSGLAELPAEPAGLRSLPSVGRQPTAFLRRVEDDGQEGRAIVAGHAAFEKVLREWGYLNEP